jgi:hypothetical protein
MDRGYGGSFQLLIEENKILKFLSFIFLLVPWFGVFTETGQ